MPIILSPHHTPHPEANLILMVCRLLNSKRLGVAASCGGRGGGMYLVANVGTSQVVLY